jgi:DNA-binding CsgD family transcriptional regulator
VDQDVALTPAEVKAIVRILSEVSASNGDGRERKALLMRLVADLIEADRWIWVVSRYKDEADIMSLSFLQDGFSEREVALFMESATDTAVPVVDHAPVLRLCAMGEHFTRRRHELVADEDWYGTEYYKRYREPLGVDHHVYSVRPLENGLLSGVGFYRNAGRDAFDERHSLIAHIIFTSADALHTMDLPDAGGSDVFDLPPRVRTTFGLLIEGLSRKKIAAHLGVSPNTVAEYSSKVYKHFGVSGQRELMLRFRSGDGRHRADEKTDASR